MATSTISAEALIIAKLAAQQYNALSVASIGVCCESTGYISQLYPIIAPTPPCVWSCFSHFYTGKGAREVAGP